MSTFKEKYLKYKKKYIELKNKMKGGGEAKYNQDLKKALEASERTALREKKEQEQYNRAIKNSKITALREKKEQEQYNRAIELSINHKAQIERKRQALPVGNSEKKNLDDIKKFNDVPGDGFCGYWCIYNALYKTVNPRTKARPYFQIGILDKEFREWLMSTLQIIRNDYNGNDIKKVTGLLTWLTEYNNNIGPLRKYFKKNGDFNNTVYDPTNSFFSFSRFFSFKKEKKKISNDDLKLLIKYTKQLPTELWSTDTILGIIGRINNINIIMTGPNAGYLFPNSFNINRDTLLIRTNGIHWTWKRIEFNKINLYLDDINEKLERYNAVKQALQNKYLKYKKKYLLLKSKLK